MGIKNTPTLSEVFTEKRSADSDASECNSVNFKDQFTTNRSRLNEKLNYIFPAHTNNPIPDHILGLGLFGLMMPNHGYRF